MEKQEILLETGTNEVEILEFLLGNQSFGINVAKIKEIIKYETSDLTKFPETAHSVLGTLMHHGNSVPLIDLNTHLRRLPKMGDFHRIVLVCEFNEMVNAFLVDGVNIIHRLSWSDITPVPRALEMRTKRLTGVCTIEGREVMILDFEGVISDVNPHLQNGFGNAPEEEAAQEEELELPRRQRERHEVKIYLADDSPTFRMGITGQLQGNDYRDLTIFENGEDAFNAIVELQRRVQSNGDQLENHLHILVTDIEMPKMDGLTLCKRIKEKLPSLPVIVLSSLISEQMLHKCESVKADAAISKRDMQSLINVLDKLGL